MSGADDTAPQLSATLALRLRALDVLLRKLGLLRHEAIELWRVTEVVRLLTSWRAEDYGDGRTGRALSTQMPAIKPPAADR